MDLEPFIAAIMFSTKKIQSQKGRKVPSELWLEYKFGLALEGNISRDKTLHDQQQNSIHYIKMYLYISYLLPSSELL